MAPDPTTDTASGSDVYGSLVELVRDMAESNKEIAHIVNVVWGQYKQVQPLIVWDDAATGQRHVSPAWTKGSIRRHLLHSSQFSMFPSVIRSMFHSIIVKQNATMIDKDTRMLVDDTRKAFLETVSEYRKFENWATAGHAGSGKSGKV